MSIVYWIQYIVLYVLKFTYGRAFCSYWAKFALLTFGKAVFFLLSVFLWFFGFSLFLACVCVFVCVRSLGVTGTVFEKAIVIQATA